MSSPDEDNIDILSTILKEPEVEQNRNKHSPVSSSFLLPPEQKVMSAQRSKYDINFLQVADGKPFQLSDFSDRPLVVHFYTS
ncbi:unnamed protein product [Amoebophrya sp. A120]|nr:unnamed protein product [Amoebophrya sp. A120]|eukprot:GSA120T00011028001.1